MPEAKKIFPQGKPWKDQRHQQPALRKHTKQPENTWQKWQQPAPRPSAPQGANGRSLALHEAASRRFLGVQPIQIRHCKHRKKQKWLLHEKKYTEYSRVILALTAIGEDVTDVGGYNLLQPLSDFKQTVWRRKRSIWGADRF